MLAKFAHRLEKMAVRLAGWLIIYLVNFKNVNRLELFYAWKLGNRTHI